MRKLRSSKMKELIQGCPARKCWNCGLNPKLVLLTHLPLRGRAEGLTVKENLRMNAIFYQC